MSQTKKKLSSSTSFKDTSFGILSRQSLVKLEVEGLQKGLIFIESCIQNHENISPELILKLHKVSFGWIFPNWAGKFRLQQVEFSGIEAPEYYKVPELIFNLCKNLEERLKNLPEPESTDFIEYFVDILSWFHHSYIIIHPFLDYNGRTVRMLTTYICLMVNLPPIEINVDRGIGRKDYISALKAADNADFSPLKKLLSNALVESLEKI